MNTQLSNKANISLDNLNASGKNTISNLSSLSEKYTNYSKSTRKITAPCDGQLFISGTGTGPGYLYIENFGSTGNTLIFAEQTETNANVGVNKNIRAKKGDVIQLNVYNNAINIGLIRFIKNAGEV